VTDAPSPLCVDARGLATPVDASVRTIRRLDEESKLPKAVKIGASKPRLAQEIESWLKAGAPPRRQWRTRS
jgi:hypothetical protein